MRDAALALGSLALILTAWAAFAWLVSRHENRPPRGLSEADRAWAEFVADGKTRAEPLPEARRAWREEDERVMGRPAEPDTALWDPVETAARRDRGRLDEGGWGALAEAAGSRPAATPRVAVDATVADGKLAGLRASLAETMARGDARRDSNPQTPIPERSAGARLLAHTAPDSNTAPGTPQPGYGGESGPDWQDDPGHDGVTPDPPLEEVLAAYERGVKGVTARPNRIELTATPQVYMPVPPSRAWRTSVTYEPAMAPPPPDDGLGYPPADDFRDWLRDSVVMRAIKEKH